MDVKFVEVEGQKFVDDGTGNPKLGDDGKPVPYVEDQSVPYHRFKEVLDKTKTLETEIQSLKVTKGKDGLTPEQEKELQAKEYLQKLIKDELHAEKEAKEKQEKQEQEKFEEEIDEVLARNTDVKRDDFLKFIQEKGEKYGVTGVAQAMSLYRDFESLSKEAKAKDDKDKKPPVLSHEGGEKIYEEDKNKSIFGIAEDAKRGLK